MTASPVAPARPRLVLHIGMHKTGTTAIQRALQAQRPALREAGVHYARTDRAPWPELPKHTSVFHAAWSDDEALREAERQTLLDEFERSGAHTLLLSEEGLSEPAERLPAFFAPWRERFEIRVVCLLRRQDRFIESLYNQFCREIARRETRTPLAFSRAAPVRLRLDYGQMLGRWQAVLGAQVQARDFDRACQDGLMASFAEAAGLAAVPLPAEAANASPDMRLCLALRRLNSARLPYALPPVMAAAAQLAREQRFVPLRHLLGRDERLRLLASVAEHNQSLARDHGVCFDDQLPADEAAAPQEDVDSAYLLELLARLSLGGEPTPAGLSPR